MSDRTGQASYRERAEAALGAFAEGMEAAALAHVTLLRALPRLAAAPGPRPLASPPPPAASEVDLDDEAREVVEVGGRLGAGAEDWRPFSVDLKIRKGWHLNANPAGASLVATSIVPVLGKLRGLRYPQGEPFGPASDVIPVYRGQVRIEGEIDHRGGGAPAVELTYQACDDARCLPPVTRLVRLQ
jgi:hypothetical protein